MEVMRLEFKSEIKEELLKILSSFSSDELRIIYENSDFENEKMMLRETAEKITNGTAKFYTFEELDEILEKNFPVK